MIPRRVFRLSGTQRSINAEIDEELRFHLESRVDDLRRRGLSEAEAWAIASRDYGDVHASRSELEAVDRRRHDKHQRREVLVSLLQDFRYTLRGVAHRPSLFIATTATLTLGIGANAVMFGVVDQLLIRPPAHVANARDLRQVYVRERTTDASSLGNHAFEYIETASYPMVRALRDRVSSLSDAVATYRSSFVLGTGLEATPIDVSLVDGNYFDVLGTRPAIGRFFAHDEARAPEGVAVAVVSDGFRRRHFGSSHDAVGATLVIEGRRFSVVGAAPPGFSGIDREANIDVWVPVGALASVKFGADWYSNEETSRFHAVVRLRSGASLERTAVEATQVVQAAERRSGDSGRDTLGTAVLGSINSILAPDGMTAEARTSLWLMGVSVIVLIIAAANVANLLVARAVQRRREIAVRLALGISRGRLFQQLLTEAFVMSAAAALIALVVSHWAGKIVQRVLLPGFAWSESVVDLRVLGVTIGAMVVACLAAGVAPIAYGLRTDVNHALKSGSREWTGSRSLLRRTLLITQAALSVILLVGAGLFLRSFGRVRGADVGIDLDRVLIVGMDLRRAGFDTVQQRQLMAVASTRLAHLPSVAGVTALGASTPTRVGVSIAATLPEWTVPRAPANGGPYFSVVDESFLSVVGTKLLRGRALLPEEQRHASRVALVNTIAAEFYWPGQDPIGKCIVVGRDRVCTQIVGVVEPMMIFRVVNEPSYAQLFVPAGHPAAGSRSPTLLIRAVGDPRVAAAQSRVLLQQLASKMPYVSVRPIADLVAPQLRPWRLGAAMFTLFGAVAMTIAILGLYSVMAYWVSQRTYEFGVRMALGGQRSDIQAMVAREAIISVGAGIALGAAASLLAAPRVADLLFRTSPYDPAVYSLVVTLLGLAGVAAAIVPTRRAAGVNPTVALRVE